MFERYENLEEEICQFFRFRPTDNFCNLYFKPPWCSNSPRTTPSSFETWVPVDTDWNKPCSEDHIYVIFAGLVSTSVPLQCVICVSGTSKLCVSGTTLNIPLFYFWLKEILFVLCPPRGEAAGRLLWVSLKISSEKKIYLPQKYLAFKKHQW